MEKKCKNYLQDKIRINMREYEDGRWKSRQQAIAVSYSQIAKYYPMCQIYLGKKRSYIIRKSPVRNRKRSVRKSSIRRRKSPDRSRKRSVRKSSVLRRY